MNSPTILDREGREIVVGAKVERLINGSVRGGMVGLVRQIGGLTPGVDLFVAWPRQPYGLPLKATRRFPWIRRSYTCPDLLVIDDPHQPTKEAASAAPGNERSSS